MITVKARQKLKDLEGTVLKINEKEVDVGGVLISCALAVAAQGKFYSPEVVQERYLFAVTVAEEREKKGSAPGTGTVAIAPNVAAWLREDLARLYGPLVAGQVMALMKDVPLENGAGA